MIPIIAIIIIIILIIIIIAIIIDWSGHWSLLSLLYSHQHRHH